MKIEVNDTELYYEVQGNGEPLIMVHGNGQDHTVFDKAAEILKEDYTCYLFDSRGHGQSRKADYLDYDIMARDYLEAMEKLGLDQVNFYGFSDGGIIALTVAKQTKRLKNLIVSGANTEPKWFKMRFILPLKISYFFKKDPKVRMMLKEPHITHEDLGKINVRTLILAGDNDIVKEENTREIAAHIKGAELKILSGEKHGTYINHRTKIAYLIKDFLKG